MVADSEVGIGVVGTGMWANNVHLAAYQEHPKASLVSVYDVNREAAERTAKRFGAESVAGSYEELLARDDIDVIDVITPNVTHAPLVLAAIEAGKHVMCEKPMAMNAGEALRMTEAADKAGVKTGVNFTWRNGGPVQYARELVAQGELGQVYHVYGCYLSGFGHNPKVPLMWRLQKDMAGTGVLGDIGSHIVDLAEWIIGERTTKVLADLNTFTEERPLLDGSGNGKVEVDDAASFLTRFEGGGMGTFLATFYATGESMDHRIDIYGKKGSIRLSWKEQDTILVSLGLTDSEIKPIDIPDRFKAPHEQMTRANVRNFVDAIADDKEMVPNFRDGLANQQVLDTVVASSQQGSWVEVPR